MELYYSAVYQGDPIPDYIKSLKLVNRGHEGLSEEKKVGEYLYIKRCYSNDEIGQKELDNFKVKISAEGSQMQEITEAQYNAV